MKKIYIYDDDKITMNDWMNQSSASDDVDKSIYELLKLHPGRTYNQDEADISVIGIPFRRSYYQDKENHKERIELAFDIIFQNTHFKKNNGSDHLLIATHWAFSDWCHLSNELITSEIWNRLENVTCTRYEYFRMSKWENILSDSSKTYEPKSLFDCYWEKTKKSILVPYKTTYEGEIISYDFNIWSNRPNLIFYHTRKSPSSHGATEIRHLPIKYKNIFSGSIGYDIPKEDWISEFKNSKFSLIIRGDTPSSHSFVNSIMYGCVPVIISDLFEDVAVPFDINLESISIKIKEKDFLENPNIVIRTIESLSEEDIKDKIYNLSNCQSLLLYNHPDSKISEQIINKFIN